MLVLYFLILITLFFVFVMINIWPILETMSNLGKTIRISKTTYNSSYPSQYI